MARPICTKNGKKCTEKIWGGTVNQVGGAFGLLSHLIPQHSPLPLRGAVRPV